jgi:DNA-binding NarL/FixJ family response regulator
MIMRKSKRNKRNSELTTRQLEVLVGICDGLTNKEIAEVLFISEKTVEKHRAGLYRKVGTSRIALVVRWAIKRKYIKTKP